MPTVTGAFARSLDQNVALIVDTTPIGDDG